MSTSFYVYPGKRYVPTFEELVDISNKKINEYLIHLGEVKSVILNVEVHSNTDNIKLDFDMNDKLIWNDDSYVWFFIHGVGGGIDTYYYKTTELDKETWNEEVETNIKAQQLRDKINQSMNIGYHWAFRRSIGQPSIISLSYGIIAATLAEITDGFIYTDDGAWDYNCFPTIPEDFFGWYFKPEFATEGKDKVWVQDCIKSIYGELK